MLDIIDIYKNSREIPQRSRMPVPNRPDGRAFTTNLGVLPYARRRILIREEEREVSRERA